MSKLDKPIASKVSDFVGNEERKQWIGSHPRVIYMGRGLTPQCDGHVGKRRCKSRSQFKFVALASSAAVSGLYCWSHLNNQIHEVTGREISAFERWANKHVPPWQDRWDHWVATVEGEDT